MMVMMVMVDGDGGDDGGANYSHGIGGENVSNSDHLSIGQLEKVMQALLRERSCYQNHSKPS